MTFPVDVGADPRVSPITEAPALASPSWLPRSSGVPELDDLAATHRRLLASRSAMGAEADALHEQFDAEDAAHRAALVSGVLADEPGDAPAVTPPEDRLAAFRALSERSLATNAALDQFLRDAVTAIEQHAPEWLGELAERREDAAAKRREAQRLLAEAEAVEAGTWRIGEWIERNAGVHRNIGFNAIPGFRHVGWDTVQTMTPPPRPEEDGMGGLRPVLVDTYPGAQKFAENLNRGVLPPYRPSREELRRSEELRTGGNPIPLAPDIRTIPEEATP